MALTEHQFVCLALAIRSKGCTVFDGRDREVHSHDYTSFGFTLHATEEGDWALTVLKKGDVLVARRQVLRGDFSYEVIDREVENEIVKNLEEYIGYLPYL